MACEFCEAYETNRRLDNELNRCTNIVSKFSVSIIVEHFKNGYRTGVLSDRPMKLIFCPECGKRLTGEVKQDEESI